MSNRIRPGGVIVLLLVGLTAVIRAQEPSARAQVPFRTDVEMVGLSVTVRDREDRLVTTLSRDDFRLVVNRKPVAIEVFSKQSRPLAVAILANTLGWQHVERMRAVGRALVDALDADDRAVIGSFSTHVAISPHVTQDRPTLHRVLTEELWPGAGFYPLWTAVDRAIAAVPSDEAHKRVVVVITTDPREACIRVGPCVAERAASRRAVDEDVLLYGLILRSITSVMPSDRPMRRLAYETGGGYLRLGEGDEGLASTMASVVEELRHEYVLGFTRREQDGRDRTISVQLTRPGLTARARRTYRLAAPPE
jgi:VWFA-related protein